MSKLSLELKDLVDLITYFGLFDSVTLTNHPQIIEEILHVPNYTDICVIEGNTIWTIDGWINEQKRRSSLHSAEKQFKKERALRNPKTKEEKETAIRISIQQGDFKRTLKLLMGVKG